MSKSKNEETTGEPVSVLPAWVRDPQDIWSCEGCKTIFPGVRRCYYTAGWASRYNHVREIFEPIKVALCGYCKANHEKYTSRR